MTREEIEKQIFDSIFLHEGLSQKAIDMIGALLDSRGELRAALEMWRKNYGWDHVEAVPQPPTYKECMETTEKALQVDDERWK